MYQLIKNANTILAKNSNPSVLLLGNGSLIIKLPIRKIGIKFWKISAVTPPRFSAKNTLNIFTGRIKSTAIVPFLTLSVIRHSTLVVSSTDTRDETTVYVSIVSTVTPPILSAFLNNAFQKKAVAIIMIVLIIKADYPPTTASGYEPGHMTPTWTISAFVFLSYNGIAMITMAGNSAVNAKDNMNAYLGAIIGGACLGGLIIALMRALTTDMAFTAALDLPMLGYSARMNPLINAVYAIILFGSVYSTGCSCYYGFTTVLPERKWKKPVIVIAAFAGFGLSLVGFKNMIEYCYPLQGYIGLIFLMMIVLNFMNEIVKNSRQKC